MKLTIHNVYENRAEFENLCKKYGASKFHLKLLENCNDKYNAVMQFVHRLKEKFELLKQFINLNKKQYKQK